MKARTRRVLPKGPKRAIACGVCRAFRLCSVCSACTLCTVCSACRLCTVCSDCRPCSDCGVAGPSQGTTVGPQLPHSYFPSCYELLAVLPTVGSLREAIPRNNLLLRGCRDFVSLHSKQTNAICLQLHDLPSS